MDDYIDDEFKSLAKLGYRGHLVSQLFIYDKKFEYTTDIPIGRDSSDMRQIISIDMSRSAKALLLGASGGGKSFILEDIFTRCQMAGIGVFVLDFKGEFITCIKPVQQKYHRNLLKNEKPIGFPVKSFYPFFFQKLTGHEAKGHEEYCQYGFDSLTLPDLLTLISDSTDTGREVMEDLFSERKITTFEQLDAILEEYQDATAPVKNKIRRTFKNMINSEVLGNMYEPPDIVGALNEGKIAILNLKGFTKFAEYNQAACAYIALALREIYNAKVDGRIPKHKHILLILDELGKYCPATGSISSREEVLRLEDLSRSEKISMFGAAQDRGRVPSTIFSQSRYIFASRTNSLDEVADIIKNKLPEEYENPQTFKADVAFQYKRMKKHGNGMDWMLIDSHAGEKKIFFPLAPLAYKAEEGDSD